MTPRTVGIAALIALVLAIGCTTAPSKPEVSPEKLNPYLLNPAIESPDPSRATARRLAAAWKAYRAGALTQAEREFTEILAREPGDPAAELGMAAVSMTRGDFPRAEQHLDRAARQRPNSALVPLYRAELARARGDLTAAHAIYRDLAGRDSASNLVQDRYQELRGELFNQLFAEAMSSSAPDTAIRLLREAVEISGDATAARLLLARKLIQTGQFDEARRELAAVRIAGPAEDEQVQQLLAEIDVGTERYQEAIARYEELVRRNPSHRARLEQIKDSWAQANMPPQQRLAVESSAITRADLAVLIYWNVPAVRFGRGLSEPPIAVDIADVVGREELIRALSFRFFSVDPLTRRVDPYRMVSAGNALRILARIATLRGVPACAVEAIKEPNETVRAQRILESCGVPIRELAGDPEAPVSGKVVERALTQVASLLRSGEERQALR
jgi:tetratricopeptide (TPR) repeat protein